MGDLFRAWLQEHGKLGFLVPEHFAMLCLALVAGLWLATVRGGGLDRERVFAAGLWIAGAALLSARLPTLIADWRHLSRHPLDILLPWEGGLSSFTGLAGALAATPWAARRQGLTAVSLLDGLSPSMALGLAIARVGCWLNGCCFGVVSDRPWAHRFPPGSFAGEMHLRHGWIAAGQASLPVLPVQLYEAAMLLALLAALLASRGLRARPGRSFAFLFFAYALGRFFLDAWRADEQALAFGLSFTRLAALAALSVGVAWWALGRARAGFGSAPAALPLREPAC